MRHLYSDKFVGYLQSKMRSKNVAGNLRLCKKKGQERGKYFLKGKLYARLYEKMPGRQTSSKEIVIIPNGNRNRPRFNRRITVAKDFFKLQQKICIHRRCATEPIFYHLVLRWR